MKEELQGKLVEILTSIQAAAGKTSDFAMAQLPDIAQSYIAYGRALNTATILFALCLAALGGYLVSVIRKKDAAANQQFKADLAEFRASNRNQYASEPYRSNYFRADHLTPFQFIPFIFSVFILCMAAPQFLLVWFAPKVWLLKEIAGLLK
jgi:hypothetical protein